VVQRNYCLYYLLLCTYFYRKSS